MWYVDEDHYFKFNKPENHSAQLVYEPVYKYDFEFEQSERYATIWEHKKIEFVNHLAILWGGPIK